MFNKKQILTISVLVIIVAAGILLFNQKFQQWPWQKGAVVPSESPAVSSGLPDDTARGKIMNYVAAHISDISPVSPVLGGNWQVTRIWFVSGSDQDLYAEYEDGHIMGRVLLEASVSGNQVSWERKAYFEPGESDWNLKSGVDTQFGKGLDLYTNQNGKWVKMTK